MCIIYIYVYYRLCSGMRRRLENQFSGALLQEHLLQGAILDNQRDPFLHRLNGICDTVGTGPEKFHDHEYAYVLSSW